MEELGEVAEGAVFEGAGAAIDHQHARTGAVFQRLLGDEFLGEVVIEFVNKHCFLLSTL